MRLRIVPPSCSGTWAAAESSGRAKELVFCLASVGALAPDLEILWGVALETLYAEDEAPEGADGSIDVELAGPARVPTRYR